VVQTAPVRPSAPVLLPSLLQLSAPSQQSSQPQLIVLSSETTPPVHVRPVYILSSATGSLSQALLPVAVPPLFTTQPAAVAPTIAEPALTRLLASGRTQAPAIVQFKAQQFAFPGLTASSSARVTVTASAPPPTLLVPTSVASVTVPPSEASVPAPTFFPGSVGMIVPQTGQLMPPASSLAPSAGLLVPVMASESALLVPPAGAPAPSAIPGVGMTAPQASSMVSPSKAFSCNGTSKGSGLVDYRPPVLRLVQPCTGENMAAAAHVSAMYMSTGDEVSCGSDTGRNILALADCLAVSANCTAASVLPATCTEGLANPAVASQSASAASFDLTMAAAPSAPSLSDMDAAVSVKAEPSIPATAAAEAFQSTAAVTASPTSPVITTAQSVLFITATPAVSTSDVLSVAATPGVAAVSATEVPVSHSIAAASAVVDRSATAAPAQSRPTATAANAVPLTPSSQSIAAALAIPVPGEAAQCSAGSAADPPNVPISSAVCYRSSAPILSALLATPSMRQLDKNR
jgi:hypothetical protein